MRRDMEDFDPTPYAMALVLMMVVLFALVLVAAWICWLLGLGRWA